MALSHSDRAMKIQSELSCSALTSSREQAGGNWRCRWFVYVPLGVPGLASASALTSRPGCAVNRAPWHMSLRGYLPP